MPLKCKWSAKSIVKLYNAVNTKFVSTTAFFYNSHQEICPGNMYPWQYPYESCLRLVAAR